MAKYGLKIYGQNMEYFQEMQNIQKYCILNSIYKIAFYFIFGPL